MRKYLLIIIALAALLSSCANYKNIEVTNATVESVKLGSTTTVLLNVEIDNPVGKTFTVKSFEGELLRSGAKFADVVLLEEAVVPAKAVTGVPVKLGITLRNPLEALTMGLNFKSISIDDFTVNAKAVVKGGGLKPKIELENYPLKSIIGYFDK